MKTKAFTLKNTAVALIMVLSVLNVSARDFNTIVKVKSLSEKKALVQLINPEYSTFKVSIKDDKGKESLYNEKVTDLNYAKVFNLSKLDEGKYKLIIETQNDLIVRNINVTSDSIEIE